MTGFVGEQWEGFSVYGLGTDETVYADCELFIRLGEVDATRSADGHVEGTFVIGETGGCFQGIPTADEFPVLPGIYILSLNCHPCHTGSFAVTEP